MKRVFPIYRSYFRRLHPVSSLIDSLISTFYPKFFQLLIPVIISCIFLNSCSSKHEPAFAGTGNPDTLILQNIFPYQEKHCHGSTITELPNHDLLAAWFQGSGERTADDVAIMGSRYDHKAGTWSSPFMMADTEGFPDINPVLFVDTRSRLWLVWYTVLAYQWESSLIKYRISTDFMKRGEAPHWTWQDVLHVKPDGSTPDGIHKKDSFVINLQKKYDDYHQSLKSGGTIREDNSGVITEELWETALQRYMDIARGSSFQRDGTDFNEKGEKIKTRVGYPLMRRLGWQTRNKPLQMGSKILLPLYSDGFDFSLIAISENCGGSWSFSEPIVGAGCIQPTLALCKDSTIVAYMRDNGPPPQRLMISRSSDSGKTWGVVADSEIPNPGSGADMVVLKNGHWLMVSNDLDEGRYRLSVWLSEDEGKTWPFRKSIIQGVPGSQTRAHYPAVIQDSEGIIHVSFTNQIPAGNGRSNVKNIAHACFTEEWLMKRNP